MALSRTTKIWLIILGIPLAIMVAGTIVLKVLFTSDRLKTFLVPRIEEATQRTVTIRAIGLSVFPSLAVDVEGLALSNRKGEGFSDRPMLELEKLMLDVRLLALLRGSIEVTTATLEKPRIFLEYNEAGAPNYALDRAAGAAPQAAGEAGRGTTSTGPAAAVAEKPSAGGYALLLPDIRIVGGAMEYLDRKGKTRMTLEGMNHAVRIESPRGDGQMVIEMRNSVEKFSYGSLEVPLVSGLRFTLDQTVAYDSQADRLLLGSGMATVQEIPLKIRGSVSAVTKVPVLDLTVESEQAGIPELLSLVPQEYRKKAEGLRGTGTATIRIVVKGSATDSTIPDITGTLSAADATIQYPMLPKPITDITVASSFTRTASKQEFRVTKLTASLGANPVSATLLVSGFDDPALSLELDASMNLAEVKDYYPLEPGTEIAGFLKANIGVTGKASAPSTMKATGAMELRGVTVTPAEGKRLVKNLNGIVRFNNEVIEARKLSLALGKSDLVLDFSMRNYLSLVSGGKKGPRATARIGLSSTHLHTADLTGGEGKPAAAPPPAIRGPAATGPAAPKSSGSGTAVRQGAAPPEKSSGVPLPDVDMEVTATIGTLTMEKFELKDVRASLRSSGGVVTLQNFTCNVFDGSVVTKGTLDLRNAERRNFDLAFGMTAVNAHSMLQPFTSFGKRLFGKLSMNTTLKGSLDDTAGMVPQTLNGQGTVSVQSGKLTGVKVNQNIASLLKLPDLEEVNFKDWSNAFSIANGRILIKDLKISALGADYLLNGSQGFDGTLEYAMTIVLSQQASAKVSVPGFAGEAVKFFKEPDGRVRLDFAVAGTMDNPSVALNTQPAQRRIEEAAKQKVADEGKKLEEKVKKKGGDLLKDLFKKKK